MPERELIDTGRDKRYVRRDEAGRFDEAMTSAAHSHRTSSATLGARRRRDRTTVATAAASPETEAGRWRT
jgi:hypothetical protein